MTYMSNIRFFRISHSLTAYTVQHFHSHGKEYDPDVEAHGLKFLTKNQISVIKRHCFFPKFDNYNSYDLWLSHGRLG